MRSFYNHIRKRENGNTTVLFSLAMTGMLALSGLVIDGGQLYMSKSELQKASNAAALSGAQEIPNMPNRPSAVNEVVDHVLDSHGEKASLLHADVKEEKRLQVTLQKDVPLFFSTLFGFDDATIRVSSGAELYPLGKGTGAVPLGVDESVALEYGKTYSLKVDAGDSTAGNFGVLALEGPGAKSYEESLTNGFEESLKVGDIVNTQTGNIAGATRRGVNYRIDNCRYPDGEYEHRDCPRVMLVIVYKPYTQTTNQLTSVEITGFAYFYVTDRMSDTDDSIKGIFIKRAGQGATVPSNPPDRGAYAIKLTE
jgi:hypothetical protein